MSAAKEYEEHERELDLLTRSGQLSEEQENFIRERMDECWKRMNLNERTSANLRASHG